LFNFFSFVYFLSFKIDDLKKDEEVKSERKIVLLPTSRKRKARTDEDNVKYPATKQRKLLVNRTNEISQKAIDILQSSDEWLSDEIVDHFIEKVKQKYADKEFYFFSSVFYRKIKHGPSEVDHWTLPDLFSYKYIIIPVLER